MEQENRVTICSEFLHSWLSAAMGVGRIFSRRVYSRGFFPKFF